MNVSQWVDSRLAALDEASDWQPDASLARARLRDLDRQAKIRRRWAWAAAAAACLGLMTFIPPRACANPRGCSQSAPEQAVPQLAKSAAPVAAPVPPSSALPSNSVPSYKESGSPDAPIVCEIYSDYECPSCAMFFRDAVPLLVAEYVQTGKVRLIHRDFPLPQHAYAKLAARYANAAGQAGQYEAAVDRLFRTQDAWGVNGDVDAQLAQALSPVIMRKVRDAVEHDQKLDDTVTADLALGLREGLHATPSIIIVWKGKRQAISPMLSYTLLKSYLDSLLAR